MTFLLIHLFERLIFGGHVVELVVQDSVFWRIGSVCIGVANGG